MLLAEVQDAMAHAVLSGACHDMPPMARGPIPSSVALGVHRDTALGGLASALRLTFPTVETLVGRDFFDQAAHAYLSHSPPKQARLSDYGAGLPDFLRTYPPAAELAYLHDVASLDRAIGHALAAPDEDVRRSLVLDLQVTLSLPVSLTALSLTCPADLIRAAIAADDDVALAAIDLTPAPRWVAIWRMGREAAVRALGPAAGLFLASLLDGAAADDALAAAFAAADPRDALQSIQAEVFAAAFCRIIQTPQKAPLP